MKLNALTLILLSLLITSCGTLHRVPQKEVIHDTLTVYKNNTVHQKDSIYFWRDRFIYTKGDTVYVTETSFKDRWKIKEVHDTTYIEKSKDNEEQTTITEYVEKELTWFQKLFITLGKILSGALVLFILYKLLKHKVL